MRKAEMKPRYRKFRQTWGTFYSIDTITDARKTLGTRDAGEAGRLLHAMNEAECLPGQNRRMAQVYLSASDPESAKRTWQFAMEEKLKTVKGPSHSRGITANKDHALDDLRRLTLAETRPEHVLTALHRGTVATNVFLRKLHNFALDMGWLLGPVLPRAKWPKIVYAAKRAITETEHRMICQREPNPERRAFYEMLWHTGASQTDAAMIRAENIDWSSRVLRYSRQKTGSPAAIRIGPELEVVLRSLPNSGPLFPYLRTVHPPCKRISTLPCPHPRRDFPPLPPSRTEARTIEKNRGVPEIRTLISRHRIGWRPTVPAGESKTGVTRGST